MTWFDYVVLLIVGLSALIAVIRGFVREVLALASWVVAFVTASALSAMVVPWLPAAIPNDSLRMLAAFVLVFGATLLAMSMLTLALVQLIKIAGLGFADRLFGLLFGLARGAAIVLTAVLLGGLTRLPETPGWRDAMLSPPLETLALAVRPWLPADLAKEIRFDAVQQVVYTARR
jgi:membrane protein required for colicin V production